jgi:hypothetical protein
VTTKPIILYLALQWLLALTASAATPTYDAEGRLVRVTYADGSTIDYPRDSNGSQLDRIVTRPVELTLTVDPPGSGTVTGAGRFPRNTTSALTATAGGAFVFVAWKRPDGTILSDNPSYAHLIASTETLVATFATLSPPLISEHPAGGLHSHGSSINLSVLATGLGQLSYRWKLNGLVLPPATPSMSIPNASFLNAGTYIVEVTNAGGTTVSSEALVTIPLDSFGTWQSKVFTQAELTDNNPLVIGPSGTSSSDGIANLLHYALGNRGHNKLPQDSFAVGQDAVFRYNRLIGSGGLSYQVEFSRDLLTWEGFAGNLEPFGSVTPNPDGVTERVGVRLNQPLRNELSKAFFRLKIQQGSEVFLNASAFNYFDDADPGLGYPNVVWSLVPIPGRFEDTASGLLFKASRPRGGGTVLTKSLHVLAGRTVEFLWDGSGGGSFMQPVCGFTPNQWHSEWNLDNSFIVCDFGNVWNSWLASPGVIYKTSVIFTPTSATLITINSVTGQEHDRKTRTGDFTLPLRPFFRGGDTQNYNGAFLRLRSLIIRSD